jgi:prepilin-type N-terminal cleavage/methylation domain-containing protein
MSPARTILSAARRAFTLIEVAIATAITGVLIVGIASAISIASRALPESDGGAAGAIDCAGALQSVGAELECATQIDAYGPTAITFRIPDRTGDSVAEIVQYAWSGVPGAPLTRGYNGGPATPIADAVDNFGLEYTTTTVSQTTTSTGTTLSDEIELASFSGWTGISTPTIQSYIVSTTAQLCQSFRVTAPANATAMVFTRVRAWVRSYDTSGGNFTFAIYRAASGTNCTPLFALGSTSLPTSSLTTTFSNPDFLLNNVRTTDLSPDFSVVISGNVSNAVQVRNYSAAAAADNGTMMGTSSDAGASWTMAGNSGDVLFSVFGRFETATTTSATTTRTLLAATRLTLQTSAGETATSVRALNQPELH